MSLSSRYSKVKLSGDITIGRKSDDSIEPGYTWVPYVMATNISVISEKESRVDKLKKIISKSESK